MLKKKKIYISKNKKLRVKIIFIKLLIVTKKNTILIVCNRLLKIIHFTTIIKETISEIVQK